MKRQFAWLLVFGFLLSTVARFVPPVSAQTGVELHGTVKDQTDAFLAAVSVILTDVQGNKLTTQTDDRGRYRFANLSPNRYTLRVEVNEFKPFTAEIDLTTKKSLTFDVTLQILLTEQLEVKPEKPSISVEPENNLSAIVLTEADIDALPDDPDEMLDVLKQMAGASGGRDDAAVYVDGFRNRGRLPPKEAILRIKLNSNPFAAEFNEPGQSRIEIITKPGADTFHGGFRFNFNDASLNARNAFALSKAPLQIRSYSANLMGPIIRNRWGFFLSVDRREQDENDVVNATIINPLTLQPEPFVTTVQTPARTTNFSLRTDYLLNKKHTIGFQYHRMTREQLNEGLNSGFNLPERAFNQSTTDNTLRFSLTSIVSERAVNELRLQLGQRSTQTRALTDAPAVIVLDAFSAGGNQGSLFANTKNQNLDLVDNLTYTYGKHVFKFGMRAEGSGNNNFNRANFGGTFTFGVDVERDATGAPILDASNNTIPISALELYRRVLAGAPGYRPSQFSIVQGDPALNLKQWELAWFAQDDWRMSKRMTISYGLRHEFQTHLGDKRNFAPRFGLVWQADKNSVIRAGTGVFNDYIDDGITLDTLRLNGVRQQQFVIQRPSFFPDIPAQFSNAVVRQPTIRLKDANLRMPYSIVSTISYERVLPANLFVSTGYTWTRGIHLLRSRNINAPLPVVAGQPEIKPFPDKGPLLEYESTGLSTRNELWTSLRWNYKALSLFGRYTLASTKSDTDGAGQTPANPYDLTTEWGRSNRDARHQFFVGGSITLPWQVRLSPLINISSGRPFNITTGRDNNRDTQFTDRPAFANLGDPGAIVTPFGIFNPNPQPGDEIIPRNFGEGPGSVNLNLNISKSFSFGPTLTRANSRAANANADDGEAQTPASQPGNNPRANRGRGQGNANRGQGGAGRGAGGGGRFGGGGIGGGRGGRGGGGGFTAESRKKYNLTLSLNMQNVINKTNLAGFNGVLTSPLFGLANRALSPRRIEASLSFRF